MKPILVINFKTYESGSGQKALDLARKADRIAREHKANIILTVQPQDIYRISREVSIPVFSQHVDPIEFGSNTGWILPENVKFSGASGTLINHAERKLDLKTIKSCISRCKEVGLKTIVCSDNLDEIKNLAESEPEYIAFEVPELIGTLRSISKVKPDSVREFVRTLRNLNKKIILLCGAGVANGQDVKSALDLGTSGVLVASAVMKAEYPEKTIKELTG